MDAASSSRLALAGQGADVECEFLTGAAGTGKTYEVRRRIEEDPTYGILCATTGIAAVNLSTVTLNSVLGYFDTASLEDNFINGFLEKKLGELADEGCRRLVIDEVSMMDGAQLEVIYEAMRRVNEDLISSGKPPMGIVLTGDFCQLPPIKAKWAFQADCWSQFEANITRLTKIWRQSDTKFLDALNAARRGDGNTAAVILRDICTFKSQASSVFDGTTVLSKNDAVDRFNSLAHSKVQGRIVNVRSYRWGEVRREWEQIPFELSLKIGAFVMILANGYDISLGKPELIYANGDCGYIKDFNGSRFVVELVRTGQVVTVNPVKRPNIRRHVPERLALKHPDVDEKTLKKMYTNKGEVRDRDGLPYWLPEKRYWVVGEITYTPLRLAYATTVHRSQGLSLDKVQVSVYDRFFGSPNMAYVALSRARTPQGLEIIGTPQLLAKQINTAKEVLKWL